MGKAFKEHCDYLYKSRFIENLAQSFNAHNDNIYVLGDMHANPIRLLAFLVIIGFIDLKQANNRQIFDELATLYYEGLSAKAIATKTINPSRFSNLLQNLVYNKEKVQKHQLILIGDTLCDRGVSDEYVLLMYLSMHINEVNFYIIFSNHDYGFLKLYAKRVNLSNAFEQNSIWRDISGIGNDQVQNSQMLSAIPLFMKGLHPYFDRIIKEIYFPRLRTHLQTHEYLFTHAPYPYQIQTQVNDFVLQKSFSNEEDDDDDIDEVDEEPYDEAEFRRLIQPQIQTTPNLDLNTLETHLNSVIDRATSNGQDLHDEHLHAFVWNREPLIQGVDTHKKNVVGHLGENAYIPESYPYINLDNSSLGKEAKDVEGDFIIFSCLGPLIDPKQTLSRFSTTIAQTTSAAASATGLAPNLPAATSSAQNLGTAKDEDFVMVHETDLPTGHGLWQSDKGIRRCTGCRKAFTFTKRKHHCRLCGKIYCSDCCPKPSFMNKAERLCIFCMGKTF